MKTITQWKKNREFESRLGTNTIQLDGAKQVGFGPKALLLSGLAGCSGIDLVDILEKMKIEFSDLTIDVEAEQTEDYPKVYKDIYITYKLRASRENEEKIKKAINLSLDKYCGVAAMLKKNSPIHSKLEILE
ncbi:MAG TPA: OsmC family protein [Chitinophagaceae bacterium]|nr:OsmC family protein [Chitinophagaceae bacterium]